MLTVNFLLVLEESIGHLMVLVLLKCLKEYILLSKKSWSKILFFFSTFKLGCQARILLCAKKSKNGLAITAFNLVHSNHPDIAVGNGKWLPIAGSLIQTYGAFHSFRFYLNHSDFFHKFSEIHINWLKIQIFYGFKFGRDFYITVLFW